jgi:transposase
MPTHDIAQTHYPVHAWHDGEEWQSTGLDHSDYRRMATHTHKQSGERRLPTPSWVFNHTDLREVICLAMEIRACLVRLLEDGPQGRRVTSWRTGTEAERLARAEKVCTELAAEQEKRLRALCSDYTTSPDAAARERLAKHIEHIDGIIKSYRAGAKLFAGTVYHYYHLGLDSVGVGLAMGIRPPLVRQTLFRLSRVWEAVQEIRNGERKLVTPEQLKQVRAQQTIEQRKKERVPIKDRSREERALIAVKMHNKGKPWKKVARRLGYADFGGLRRLLISQGLYQPTGNHVGWDGRRIVDYAAAAELHAQGLNYREIAERLGFTDVAVWKAIKRGKPGVPASERHNIQLKIDPEQVLALRAQGLNYKEISKRLGCSLSGACAAVRRMQRKALREHR